MSLDDAKNHYEQARQLADSGDVLGASAAFAQASKVADPLWRSSGLELEDRSFAARIAADAAHHAGMLAMSGAEATTSLLESAVVVGAEVFEAKDLSNAARWHGLYRAQCSAFELGHRERDSDPAQAEGLFRDATNCAARSAELPAEDEGVSARIYANAAASAYAVAQLVRDRGDIDFRGYLEEAGQIGSRAIADGKLSRHLAVETMLVMADASHDLAASETDRKVALGMLRDALGWTRQACMAPGADAVLQAKAFHRGGEIACVYGLTIRHDDHDEGMEALVGATELSLSAARSEYAQTPTRASAFEAAIRTWQNVGLLSKSLDPGASRGAFETATNVADEAEQLAGVSPRQQSIYAYLGANARLEQAILTQTIDGPDAAAPLYKAALESARRAVDAQGGNVSIRAKAALLGCGATGRTLALIDDADADAVNRGLGVIETLGRAAANAEGAPVDLRAKGAFFAADASNRLATRLSGDDGQAAQARAEAMRELQLKLEAMNQAGDHDE